MEIHESSEDYLETILILQERNGYVRSIDIAEELSFSKPSVSIAMKKLRLQGYIETGPSGSILLTDSGRKLAEGVFEKHTLIANWLTRLGVDPKVAAEDACRIEHVISPETFAALKEHTTKSE